MNNRQIVMINIYCNEGISQLCQNQRICLTTLKMRDLVSNKIHQLQVQRYKLDYIFSQLFFFCYLKMFHKIAKHYVKKRDFQRAIQSLEEAEKLQHIRHPDFNVLSTKAKTLLDIGSYQESLLLATTILHNKGIINLQFDNCFL